MDGIIGDAQREKIQDFLEAEFTSDGDGDSYYSDIVLVVIVMAMVLGLPILIVYFVLYFSHKKRQDRIQLLQSALKNEQSLPDQVIKEIFDIEEKSLLKDVQKMVVGAVVSILFFIFNMEFFAVLALIPFCIGLINVIFWRIRQNDTSSEK